MKTKHNTILRLAIAAAFAGGAAVSHAALLTPASAVKFASELPTTGLDLMNGASDISFSGTVTTFTPSAGQQLQVRVLLSNGATFGGNPTVTCNVTTAAGAGNTVTGVLNLGGNTFDSAVFTISDTAIVAQVTTSGAITTGCAVSASGITVASGAHSDINASITYQYGTLASGAVSGALITFVKGVSAYASAATNVTALVTGGFTTIAGGISTTTASLGKVYYASNGSGRVETGANAIQAATALSSASISIAGNALAVAKTTGGVYLVTAGHSCSTANIVASAGPSASVTFSGLTPTQVSGGLQACITFNSTSAIPEGSITATMAGVANTGYSVSTGISPNTIITVNRNGSSTRAMNIPAANNTDQAYIRITNTSSLAGKVYGTLYGQDGAVLGTANATLAEASAFVANATVVLSAADLKTKLGITSDWTGRAQLVVTAETPTMRAQNLVRTASGTLVNVGGDTSSSNN